MHNKWIEEARSTDVTHASQVKMFLYTSTDI